MQTLRYIMRALYICRHSQHVMRRIIVPAQQGIWRPQKIANPAYYKDDTPLANLGKIDAAAIEIWTMDNNYYFNDIVVANDPAVAEEFRLKTWTAKHEQEVGRSYLPSTSCATCMLKST